MDRAAEILFGLIMALSFTCSISIATTQQAGVRELLFGAIGCNLAWGIVDSTMYLIGTLAERNRSKKMLKDIRDHAGAETIKKYLAEVLPPEIAAIIEKETFGHIEDKVVNLSHTSEKVRLTIDDLKKAFALFLLVFISTFPVVIPFVLIHDTRLALRVSNMVAIVLMFLCGWSVASYVGARKWTMSIAIVLVGIMLVVITIALGG